MCGTSNASSITFHRARTDDPDEFAIRQPFSVNEREVSAEEHLCPPVPHEALLSRVKNCVAAGARHTKCFRPARDKSHPRAAMLHIAKRHATAAADDDPVATSPEAPRAS
ncbi:hypothetical protein GCM10011415_16320 [Salipiger pallidus]|uniref:Uncharacterized protein n=1 Tax=Salipiger pallidus TaxID=1775170 RepID=A0A8J2ZIU8_9RHOB|nr:hypothetical protein GCM10011415_16320 [Salipiger pallidus]